MIIINEETAEMEIKEFFYFEANALPIIKEIKSDLKYFLGDYIDLEDMEFVKSFLSHEINKNDKIEILKEIKFEYEFRCHRSDDEFSIFDSEIIRSAIAHWIEKMFDFNPFEF